MRHKDTRPRACVKRPWSYIEFSHGEARLGDNQYNKYFILQANDSGYDTDSVHVWW